MSYGDKLLECARWYICHGLPVFPCKPKAKQPATPHGCKDATTAPDQVAAWWNGIYLYNIGIATGNGIVVLDVDINHNAGKYGDETLAELERQYGPLPDTWMCLTGGGGIHYYFACGDPTLTVGTSFAPGLDYRGAGGYVIAPPSTHENGQAYEWEAAHMPHNTKLAQLPDWLHTLMLKGRGTHSETRAADSLETVTEGSRNDTLFRLACSLRSKGMSEAGITAALLAENQARCRPPLDYREVKRIAKSGSKYPPGDAPPSKPPSAPPKEIQRLEVISAPDTSAETDKFLSYFKTLDEFEEEETRWVIPGWIPEGQVTLVAADGGVGKTVLWCNILAALSKGTACILDPPGTVREPGKVAFLTTEDSIRKKLKKKLRLAGANLKNIITPDFVAANRDGALNDFKFGTKEMERFLRSFKLVLCVFDPVQGFIPPRVNMGSRNEMRDCLAPLLALGEDTGTTFLIVCHTNKRKGASGRERVADSADMWDISRSVLMAGFTGEKGIRYLSNEKNNYAELQETVLFSIDQDGQPRWEGTTWKRDRDYIQAFYLSRSAPKREDCKAFILKTVNEAGGALPTSSLDDKASAAGYSFSAVKRAKSELKAEGAIKYFQTGSSRTGDNVWHIQALKGLPEVAASEGPDALDQVFLELPNDGPTPFDPAKL